MRKAIPTLILCAAAFTGIMLGCNSSPQQSTDTDGAVDISDDRNSNTESKNNTSGNPANNNSSDASTPTENVTVHTNQDGEPMQEESILDRQIKFEMASPTDYVNVTYKLDYNILSGKDVIKGTLTNTAQYVTYKDIGLTITFYSKTDVLLDTKDYVLYDYISPQSSKEFKIKDYSPAGTATIGVTITDAKVDQ